jgi:branched-subunit amino acid transport protein
MTVLLTITVVGFLGYCMRAVFIVSLAKHAFPPLALRVLEYVAPAVMGALVMTMLTGPEGTLVIGVPEVAGLVVAAGVVVRTRNVGIGLISAMTVFWILRSVIS